MVEMGTVEWIIFSKFTVVLLIFFLIDLLIITHLSHARDFQKRANLDTRYC